MTRSRHFLNLTRSDYIFELWTSIGSCFFLPNPGDHLRRTAAISVFNNKVQTLCTTLLQFTQKLYFYNSTLWKCLLQSIQITSAGWPMYSARAECGHSNFFLTFQISIYSINLRISCTHTHWSLVGTSPEKCFFLEFLLFCLSTQCYVTLMGLSRIAMDKPTLYRIKEMK